MAFDTYAAPMAQALWMRLREVQWQEYEVSQGNADRLPKILQDLASRKRARSMKACHEVWQLLCRGGVHSAAVIVVPYLVEIIEISIEDVQMEIADTLKSCAVNVVSLDADWADALTAALLGELPELKRLAKKAKGDSQIAYARAIDAIAAIT